HVDYTDRNNTAHTIADFSGKTSDAGEITTSFTGLTFEGAGTVTATLVDDKGKQVLDAKKNPITAQATFSVMDLSPPVVSITAPAPNAVVASVSKGSGDFTLTVSAKDEIGVSQTFFQAVSGSGVNLNLNRSSSRIVDGSTQVSTDYNVNVNG